MQRFAEFKQKTVRRRCVDIKDSLILWHDNGIQDVSAIISSPIFSLLLIMKQWTAFLRAWILF